MVVVRAILLALLCASRLVCAAPVRVVLDANYPPFVHRTQDGGLEGYTVDLWRLWERKTGRQAQLIAVNWSEVQPMLASGRADIIDPIFRTRDRGATLDFSNPYMTVATAVYADASIGGIHNVASLKGFEVGVQASDACAEELRHAGVTGVRIFPSYQALVDAAASQSIKLLCMDENSADYRLYQLGLQRQYVKAFELTRNGVRRAVRKGDAATLAMVEEGMAKITPAELDELHDKWMGRTLPFVRYAGRLVAVLLVLGGVVLLLVAWLSTVRKAVRARTAELEHEKVQLRILIESSPDAIWLKAPDGAYLACNTRLEELVGRPRREIIGHRDSDFFAPAAAAQMRASDLEALRSGQPLPHEQRVVAPGGTKERVYDALKTAIVGPDGKVLGVLGVARDVTTRIEQERTIRRQERLLMDMSAMASIGAWELEPATGQLEWTDEIVRIYELPPGQPVTLAACLACYGADDRALAERALAEATADGTAFDLEVRILTPAGTHKWIRVLCRPVTAEGRTVLSGTVQDLSEQKKKDELIWRQTNFDPLTGLPNRRLFLDRLEQDVRKAQGAGHRLSVLLLDIDRFKDVNDGFGYARGDEALVELTRRMASRIPADATMARLGGGMFALAAGQGEQQLHLETVAAALIDAVAAPMRLRGDELAYLSASIGISVYPDDAADPSALLANAEHAMYRAKRAGRGRFQYFTPSLQQQASSRLKLTSDLRMALARRELHVYYQPIVETGTGRVRKAETLLRWIHPELGMVSPATFIPLAEETGLIDEIGEWVLGEAIASIERWRRKYDCAIELSVNISPLQFERQGRLPWLQRILDADSTNRSITVEITEGVLVSDAEQISRCLGSLHGAGAKVSIDDFGTGFSSLAYLKHFDVDYLKIDKSFIHHLAEDGSDMALTEAIVGLAHRLGIEVIAEGVEHGAQRDLLAAFGCDYIQGWYFSKALPREAFETYLERNMALS